MRLAKLTLAGFKSFADKTEIPFNEPIVGIVGPNGCGKSNVVDAIKWVLGDQSPKSLRGGAMLDVIFNGSAKRKPAGMASVTLTFDNPVIEQETPADGGTGESVQVERELDQETSVPGGDSGEAGDASDQPLPLGSQSQGRPHRALPIDTDQVAVTRQLYRDGTSEYLINNQRARLRDIKELFMDTGVGTDAYSIIEQGKVARMLEANAAERRQIFEEAAGVSRFKARKKEALRKLDRTEQNLALVRQRLEDTEKRLRSVKMQAARARSFQEHSANLKTLQLTFSLAEYHRLTTQLSAINETLEQAQVDRLAAQNEFDKHESALLEAETEQAEVAQRSAQLDQARVEQDSARRQAQQAQAFAESTLNDVTGQIQRDQTRLDGLVARQNELATEATEHNAQLDELAQAQAGSKQRLDDAQEEHRNLQHKLNETRSELEDEKNGLADLLRRSSKLQNEIASIDTFEKSLVGTRQRLDDRNREVADQLETMLTQRDGAQVQLATAIALITDESAKLDEQKSLASRFGEQQRQLSDRLAESRERRAELDARRNVLQEMEDRLEGVSDPVKAVLARASDDGEFKLVRGLMAELIDCDVSQAGVVEAALGEYQQALVVDRLADLCSNDVGQAARDALGGRVSFLALDQPPLPDVGAVHALASQVPCVIDLVRYPTWLGPVAWRLLGRTLVVRDLDTAMMLRAGLPAGYRFVTEAGELLDDQCRVVAGPVSNAAGGGLISRRSELAALQSQLTELDAIISSDASTLATLSQQAAHLEEVTSQLQKSIFDANGVKVELASRLDSLAGQIGGLEKERPSLTAEAQAVHTQLREADEKRTAHQTEAGKLAQESEGREERQAVLSASIAKAQEAAEQAREAVTTLRVEAGQRAEQLNAAQRQSRQFEVAQADVNRQHKLLEEELSGHHRRIDELKAVAVKSVEEASHAGRKLDELITQCELMTRKVTVANELLATLKADAAQRRSAVESLDKQLHQAQMSQRELEVKTEAVTQRCHDQLGLSVSEAYASRMAGQDVAVAGEQGDLENPENSETQALQKVSAPDDIDWKAVKAEMKELQGKIARLGTVNVDAIDEEAQLADKQDELGDQVKDIEEAERQLHTLIERINDDSRTRFIETFEQVKENFAGEQGMFRKLFGGGRAELELEADENGNIDVLESGITIRAKPPGKEPRGLSQLSGGEKTMTAVALLMAIFKSRPSPYAILDEVDAALDEANTERFINVIKGFLDKSHFIVITHHKRTMMGCDTLYGITMQERGVSTRVSVDMKDVGSDGSLAVNEQAASIHEDRKVDSHESLSADLAASPSISTNERKEDSEAVAAETKPSSREQLAAMLEQKDPVEV
ncbi:MAG: chromosome segregation protein SMC [Algisphaera sp.]